MRRTQFLIIIIFAALAGFACSVKTAEADPSALVADAEFSGGGLTLPEIKLDSPDAKAVNAELEKLCASWREWNGDGITITADYAAAARGSLLSVLVTETFDDGISADDSFYSYVFDTATGKKVEYGAFLAEFGIAEERAELFIKEAFMSLAAGWTDDDFMPYQTLRGALAQTLKNYSDAVSSGYLPFYIDKDGAPSAAVMAVTPGGSGERLIRLAEGSAAGLLRGVWALDLGDRTVTLKAEVGDRLTVELTDADGAVSTSLNGSYTIKADGAEFILRYTGDGGEKASARLAGTFIYQFIAAPSEDAGGAGGIGAEIIAPGEYVYVETAQVYDTGLMD